jgi:TonB-linked SusC/RagA family outer membrane protein
MLAYERQEAQGAGMAGSVSKFPFYLNDQWWSTSTNTSDDGVSKSQAYSDYLIGRKSWIGQFFYDYAGKYMANFTYRYDGSMQFAPENRWGFFPSGSVGWIVSKENFFKVNGIENLKLRASAGLVGNDAIGGWQWLQSYAQGASFLFGNPTDVSSGLQYGAIVNRDLTWEKSLNKNYGLDVNFLKHFNATLEYWSTNTYDILGSRNFTKPATFSPTLPAVNYGKMKAHGWDVALGYGGEFGHVHFNTNLAASYGSAKYVTRDETPTYDWQRLTGRYNTYIAGYTVDKMLRSQAEVDAFMQAHPTYKAFGLTPKAGNFVYQDLSGPTGKPDGIIDNWDQSVLKNRNNPLVMGWNFSVEWKGLSLSATFSGRLGQWKSFGDVTGGVDWNRIWKTWATDSWTPETPNAWLPGRVWAYNNAQYTMNTQNSNFWYANANFLRLKFLNLGYNIPRNLYNKLGVQNIRFFASGSNLFLISKFNTKFYDPELGSGVAFPIVKSFNAGFNVSF